MTEPSQRLETDYRKILTKVSVVAVIIERFVTVQILMHVQTVEVSQHNVQPNVVVVVF